MAVEWRYVSKQSQDGRYAGFYIMQGATRICEGMVMDDPKDLGAKEAIGRLIASAPKLRAALEALLDKGMTRHTVEQAVAALEATEAHSDKE